MQTSAYIAIGLAFSSTIVVLKLLSDRDETESTFGRLSIGILIVQDILIMVLFLGLATFQKISVASGVTENILVIGTVLGKMILVG